MLPETALTASHKALREYLGQYLAGANVFASPGVQTFGRMIPQASLPGLMRQELQNIARERARAATYIVQYVAGPRVTALTALLSEVDALVIDAEAALAS